MRRVIKEFACVVAIFGIAWVIAVFGHGWGLH